MYFNRVLSFLLSALTFGIVITCTTVASLFAQSNSLQNSPKTIQSNSVNVSPQTKTFGIRKIYAPESQIQKWPLGNNKFIHINADKFEQMYRNWESLYDEQANLSKNDFSSLRLYISSAKYIGKLNPSGELTGQGEWYIKYNKEFADNPNNASLKSEPFILLPNLKSFMEKFTFTPSSDNNSQINRSFLKIDSLQYIMGALPSGQQIFYSPNEGILKFTWTAAQKESDTYVLQSPLGLVSQWQITIPENKSIIVTDAHTNQTMTNFVLSTLTQNAPSNSENKTKTYTIHLANTQCVYVHITDKKQELKNPNLLYRQESQYTFYPHQLSTVSTFTFTTKDEADLPAEIPFKVIHNPNLLWRAEFDGRPVEVHSTDTGYYVSLTEILNGTAQNNSSSPNNNRHIEGSHILNLINSCTMEELSTVNQIPNKSDTKVSTDSDSTVKYPLPRIELENGVWVSSSATCNTIQKPLGISSDFGEISEFKITSKSRYLTSITLFKKNADIFMTFSPFKESFFSQNDTIVHWDGSQLSFMDSIYLWAEQGSQYVLTAPLPERLTVDKVQISPNSTSDDSIVIDNWEIQTDEKDPLKQTLIIYLQESVRPGRSLSIDINSHIITSLSKPITVNRLQPILFDGFTPHRQSVQVNINSNQKFVIGDRVIYSPDKHGIQKNIESQPINLPEGIVQIPISDDDTKNNINQSNTAFIIDVKKWGDYNTSIETQHKNCTAHGEVNIDIKSQFISESVDLQISGGSSRIKTFHFEFASNIGSETTTKKSSTDKSTSNWSCILINSDNEFCVPVTEEAANRFLVEFPINIATPFTLKLSRKIYHNGTYQTNLLRTPDCNSISVLTTIHTNPNSPLNIQTRNIEKVTTQAFISNDTVAGQYLYQENYSNNKSQIQSNTFPYLSINVPARQTVSTKNTSSSTLWAWSQQINEYHFEGGSVLVSAEWDIENRFPPQCKNLCSQKDNQRIFWTIPDLDKTQDITSIVSSVTQENNSAQTPRGFITGLWIDNILIPSTDIQQNKDGVFSIPAPVNKKRFTMTVQWTLYDNTLSSVNQFGIQTPTLKAPVFQTKWNVYYPTAYRQLLSFQSSDPTVDGFFQRLFGPLIRNESNTLNFVTHLWNGDTNSSSNEVKTTSPKVNSEQVQQCYAPISSHATLNSLNSPNSWNCCSFTNNSSHKKIYIIRNEVSECFRWSLFIISLCWIFSFCRRVNTQVQNHCDSNGSLHSNNGSHTNNLDSNVEIVAQRERIAISVTNSSPTSQMENNINKSNSLSTPPMTESKISVPPHPENLMTEKEKFKSPTWGVRRWLVCIGLISAIFTQILPWLFSIPFSSLFMSSLLSLLIYGMQTKQTQNSLHNSIDSTHKAESAPGMNIGLWSVMFVIATLITNHFSVIYGQDTTNQSDTNDEFPSESVPQRDNVLPTQPLIPSHLTPQPFHDGNYSLYDNEYQIFIPLDAKQQSKEYYYVPQNLMEIINNANGQNNNRSWITYRATYVGQLLQQMNRIETTTWSCSLEIETFQPNTTIELPSRMKNSFFSMSDIVIRKGTKDNIGSDKNNNSDTIWTWENPIKSTPQWDEQHQSWFFKIVQPGRYLIETRFQPQITNNNGKNEISFPIVTSMNSILELTVPDSMSDLEFPDSIGVPQNVTPDTNDNNVLTSESNFITKRVILGATQQVTCRWNTNQSVQTGPLYNIDTLSWWHIYPDHSTLKVRYNLHVESGIVSSIAITIDPHLILLSNDPLTASPYAEVLSKKSDSNTNIDTAASENEKTNSTNPNIQSNTTPQTDTSIGQSDNSTLIVPLPNSGLVTPPTQHYIYTNETNSTSQILSITPDKTQKNSYIVTFRTPVRKQTTFDLEFFWNQSSIGSPQFPITVFPNKQTGRSLLAFTLDPQLQVDWSSSRPGFTAISSQKFFTQWTISNGENTSESPSPTTPIETSRPSLQTLVLPPPPKEGEIADLSPTNLIPDVAYDLNLLKRKSDSADDFRFICLNIQPVTNSAQAQADAFLLAYENRLLCQIKWDIVSSKGERSRYCVEIPESISNPEKIINVISATIRTDNRSYNASAYLHHRTLEIYWGTPISGNCTLELVCDIKSTQTESNTETKFLFDFPDLKNVDVSQYRFTLSRTDSVKTDINFNSPKENYTEFSAIETPVETPISDKHQQVVGSWETVINNLFPRPVPFLISINKNTVKATLNYTATLSLENQPTLYINGTLNVEQGILDEIEFQLPADYYGPPISSKASIECQLNTDSITSNSYSLRPQLPFTSGSEFQLSIPLESSSKQWKIAPIQFSNVTVTNAIVKLPEKQNESSVHWEAISTNTENRTVQNNNEEHTLINTMYIGTIPQTSQKWIHVFDLNYNVHTISEYQYYTSVEFAMIQTGEKQIQITLPDKCTVIDVQNANRSVQWTIIDKNTILIPTFVEKEIYDVRIIYSCTLIKSLYSEPIIINPIRIANTDTVPSINWTVNPWKKFNKNSTTHFQQKNFLQKQNMLLIDLVTQMSFVQTQKLPVTDITLTRFQNQYFLIENQINQFLSKTNDVTNNAHFRANFKELETLRNKYGTILLELKDNQTTTITETFSTAYSISGIQIDINSTVNDNITQHYNLPTPIYATTEGEVPFTLEINISSGVKPWKPIWWILASICIPIFIWLSFFPPVSFIPWRPSFTLGTLGLFWLLEFNLYGVALLFLAVAFFDFLKKLRRLSRPNIIPLRVR